MKTIEIKNRWDGSIIKSIEVEDDADLSGADLSGADLSGADLSGADLSGADLSGADLRHTNLRHANLRHTYLSDADLSGADLSDADLSDADLSGANLRHTDLSEIHLSESTGFLLPQCPDGAFIGWKKANTKIVKLQICEDSKRSSATSLKCRCSKAIVLAIENIDGSDSGLKQISSNWDGKFIYTIGEIKEIENFDGDRFKECSSGIHFFISREMAVQYN